VNGGATGTEAERGRSAAESAEQPPAAEIAEPQLSASAAAPKEVTEKELLCTICGLRACWR